MKENDKTHDKKELLHLLTAYCSREEHCEYDVKQKMHSYNAPQEWAEEIIDFLKKNKYIDNARYAQAYANDKFRFNKWGKSKISFALSKKQIPSEIIREAIENIDSDNYLTLIKDELSKKAKSIRSGIDYEKKAKLYRFGLSRGFESDLVLKALDEIGF